MINMFLEIFIYLVIAFGILILCITMVEKDNCLCDKYITLKRNDVKVKLMLDIEGLSEEDSKKLAWIIRKGKFEDVYDVVNEFETLTK